MRVSQCNKVHRGDRCGNRTGASSFADVYAIAADYLRHRTEVDSYLIQQEHEAGTAIQAMIESTSPPRV